MITDAMIDAGIDAWDEMLAAMQAREESSHPEDMPDYDQGDVFKAIYTAMTAARVVDEEVVARVSDLKKGLQQTRDKLNTTIEALVDFEVTAIGGGNG